MKLSIYRELKGCLDEEQLVALATVVKGEGLGRQLLLWPDGRSVGGLGSERAHREIQKRAAARFVSFESGRETVSGADGEIDVFVEIHPPRPKLIVVGAVHAAIPLLTFARVLGFRTVVVDPRSAFATAGRFEHADELLVEWPQQALPRLGLNEASYVTVLSHDLKIDLPALQIALRSPARYVGALGSKRTHQKRLAALKEEGFSQQELGRIHNPIGLDLGGRRADEIALAIMAEMVAVSHGVGIRVAESVGRTEAASPEPTDA